MNFLNQKNQFLLLGALAAGILAPALVFAESTACAGIKAGKLNLEAEHLKRIKLASQACGPKLDGVGGELSQSLAGVSDEVKNCFTGDIGKNANWPRIKSALARAETNLKLDCEALKKSLTNVSAMCSEANQRADELAEALASGSFGNAQSGAFGAAGEAQSLASQSYNELRVHAAGLQISAEDALREAAKPRHNLMAIIEDEVDAELRKARAQVGSKLATRRRYATSYNSETLRFDSQKDVKKFYRQISSCEQRVGKAADRFRNVNKAKVLNSHAGISRDMEIVGQTFENSAGHHAGQAEKLSRSQRNLGDSRTVASSGISGGEGSGAVGAQ